MNIAYLCSNAVAITSQTKKGTEIFDRILLSELAKYDNTLAITAFASKDSSLPVPIESMGENASSTDHTMPREKHVIFELALLSKAFAMQNEFDLYHVNIGDGDLVMPFLRFVKKPILITIHHLFDLPYARRYFSHFQGMSNVHFIAPSNAIKRLLPHVNYAGVIHHGIEIERFAFVDDGGEQMLWAGRGIPTKGLDTAIAVADVAKKPLTACIVRKSEYQDWVIKALQNSRATQENNVLTVQFDTPREDLILQYQKSKIFLFPIRWEEPFGLVLLEAMACGTPVIAYARGAVPEVIRDGVTGYLVNPSDDDIRGDFVVKKTGIDGLAEAVKRVYAMNDHEYKEMRLSARRHVETNFSAIRMAKDYIATYREVVSKA